MSTFSSLPDAPHSHDPEALESFAEALAALDYTHDGILALLGDGPFAAMTRDHIVPAKVRVRNLLEGTVPSKAGQRRLAGAVELFLLGGCATRETLDAVLGEGAFDLLRDLNLLAPARDAETPETPEAPQAPDAAWRTTVDLRPHSADDGTELWVASDLGAHQRPGALRRDHVLGVGQASLTLAQLTEREPVDTALDLGTGCGIQTFHLLAHARRVTVTDLSERALAFTRFNLLLNAAALKINPQRLEDRVELLPGSLLEPVAGREFDLIVSNPPFVITPRREGERREDWYTYRDGGLPGDQLVAELVRRIPEHLRPGGRAQMLGNWEIHEQPAEGPGEREQQDWDLRPRAWLPEGAEAWFIQREELPPEQYAETWLRDAAQNRDPQEFERAYTDYLVDFASRGVSAVGFGMIWLRRPEIAPQQTPLHDGAAARPGAPLRRFEEITYPIQQPIAPHLGAAVRAWDLLRDLEDEAFEALHLEVAEDVTEERHQRPGAEHPGGILLRQGAGLRRTELLSTEAAGFVSACDGQLAVGQILDALGALLGWEDEQPRLTLRGQARRLVERGFLGVVDPE